MQHGAFHHHLHRLVFLLKCGYHFPLEGLWVWKGPAINAREETNSYKNWKLIICALQEIRNISVYMCAYIYMWDRLVYMCVHIYIYIYMWERERESLHHWEISRCRHWLNGLDLLLVERRILGMSCFSMSLRMRNILSIFCFHLFLRSIFIRVDCVSKN